MTQPYPTIADKVRLYREHGFDARDYFDGEDTPTHVIRLTGERSEADRAVEIANQYNLPILELSYIQPYDGIVPIGDPFWILQFSTSL